MPKIKYFRITDIENGQQVGLAKSFKELSEQLTQKNFKGVSVDSLKRKKGTFTKGKYEISEMEPPKNTRQYNKPLGAIKEKTYKFENKTVIEINKLRKADFNAFLTTSRREGLFKFIQNRLKNIRKNSNVFSVIIKFKSDGEDKQAQTTFEPYNKLHIQLNSMIERILSNYEDMVDLIGIDIQYFKKLNLPESYVFGCKENEKLLNEIMEYFYNSLEKNKYIPFLKKYLLVSPSTYSLCVARACLISDGVSDNNTIEERVRNWSKRKKINDHMTLEEKLSYISNRIKKVIEVYDHNLNIVLTITPKNTEGTIKILVYASHSYGILPRKDNFNEIAFFKNFDRQIQMYPELSNDEEPKESEEEETESKTKPKKVFYGSYDYETYNSDKSEGKRTCDVKPYAVGWTHNINGDYKENYQYIYDDNDTTLQFIKELSKIKVDNAFNNKLLLYAHNAGKFDAYEIIYKLIGYTNIEIFHPLFKDGRIFQFSIKLSNKLTIEFRDSYILCAGSLDKLLKEFKCDTKKLTGEVNHKLLNDKSYIELKEKVLPYLKNDVLGLYELVNSIRTIYKEDYNVDLNEALTCASTTRKFFIKNHKWKKYPIYNIPFNQYLELKDYYYGGRCECFHIGEVNEDLFYYDFTSLYPYVMGKSLYPYGKYKKYSIEGQKFNSEWFGMVKCYVKTTDFTMIPYLPYKDKDGKLTFPHFKEKKLLWITTEEWKYIINNNLGYEIEPLEILDYGKQKDYYFKDMVDDLFKAKKQAEEDGNDARRAMAKIIINSLYGFWGIKLSENEQLHIQQFKNDEKKSAFIQKHLCRNRLIDYEDVGDKTLIKTKEKLDGDCANIIIAQFTTSYARTELYKLMMDIKKKGGKTRYSDTDSVVTNIDFSAPENSDLFEKYRLCVKGENLGDLTNEAGSVKGKYTKGVFLGCKSYMLVSEKFNEDDYMKDLSYSTVRDKKFNNLVIRKFKGINTKNIYKNRKTYQCEYDISDKRKNKKKEPDNVIEFSEEANFDNGDMINLYKDNGFKMLWIDDYVKMAKGYKVVTDNWNFLSGTSSLSKEKYLQYSENKKISKCSKYSKGIVDKYDGSVKPLEI